MRADRLVAVLLMLQTNGQVTCAQVARELEVSERTARRDLEALGTAGLPITSQRGHQGGWRLVGDGRTDLTGLTGPEAQALFLAAGGRSPPTPEVRAALRKLLRALPEPLRAGALAAGMAILVDPAGWDRPTGAGYTRTAAPPHLPALRQAVLDGEQVELQYRSRTQDISTRTVSPLGLVSKGRSWYLLAGTSDGQRTFRVDRVTAVGRTGLVADRPPDFDLATRWRAVTDNLDDLRTPVRARAMVTPAALPVLRFVLGSRVRRLETTPDAAGRFEVELRGHSARSLAAELAGLGSLLEVLEPPAVRAELAVLGAELTTLYERAEPR